MRRENLLFAGGVSAVAACLIGVFVGGAVAVAQNTRPPVTFTSDEDHQNMMDQLGIKALRPGPVSYTHLDVYKRQS